jgi:hypothetical protein
MANPPADRLVESAVHLGLVSAARESTVAGLQLREVSVVTCR